MLMVSEPRGFRGAEAVINKRLGAFFPCELLPAVRAFGLCTLSPTEYRIVNKSEITIRDLD